MQKRSKAVFLAAIAIDRQDESPLYRQLYFGLREAILDGRLKPGMRLPATRTLAQDLSLSRNTVVTAFDQLLAEGYIEGRTGAGTYVSHVLPEELLSARRVEANRTDAKSAPSLSKRGRKLATIRRASNRRGPSGAFSIRVPELEQFPFDDWARLLARRWRRPPRQFLIDGDPTGYRPLREAIANYLGAVRALHCSADQVIIVSGSQQALDIATRALIDTGDSVWVEEPGFAGTIGSLIAAGANLVPVPIDEEGIDIRFGQSVSPAARLACVTPSHQFPLGVVMTLRRRLELLDWARSADAFILEDDYDSEYRYSGRPLTPLQGLDTDGRVIYLGSMSKVMFPGLRLGYMVVPEGMVEAFRAIRALVDFHPSSVPQAALADFIAEGYLAAHIRRMRTLYAERQETLLSAAARELDGALKMHADEAGMHLVGYLPDDADDKQAADFALAEGVVAAPLSSYYYGPAQRKGMVLGYAGLSKQEINKGAIDLARGLRKWRGAQ